MVARHRSRGHNHSHDGEQNMTKSRIPLPLENAEAHPNLEGSRCARCGAPFHCGMNGPGPCWCAAYPQVMPVPQAGAGCYCPDCLAALTAEQMLGKGGVSSGG
jgi:hypothetical protein